MVRRAKRHFAASRIRLPRLDRLWLPDLSPIFKSNYDTQARTAFSYPFSVAFQWHAWRQLR
jgi:hypothetical protein